MGALRSAALVSLVLGIGASCGRDSGERTLPVDLFRRLEAAPAILLSVDDGELSQAASGARDRLVEQGWNVRVASGDADESLLPRIRVGSFNADWARPVAELLGWTIDERILECVGQQFRLRETLLIATVPDPERVGLPLTVVLATKPSLLAFGLERVQPGWRASARFWELGDARLEMALTPAGRPRLDEIHELAPPWRAQVRRYRDVSDVDRQIKGLAAPGLPIDLAQASVKAVVGVRSRIDEWVGESADTQSLTRLVFEPTVDRMVGYPIGDRLSFSDPWPGRVVALSMPSLPDETGAAAARLWLTEVWGNPAHTWIAEGAAYDRADTYWKRELEEWGAHLLSAGLVPSIRTIVTPELARDCSVHQRAPVRALLVRYLARDRGVAEVERLWRGEVELEASDELQAGFASYLDETLVHAAPDPGAVAARRVVPRMRGAVFTNSFDPQTRAAVGWGSEVAAASLDQLARLGADAVSLPCFFADEQDGGDGRPFAVSNPSGALDGDAALAMAVAQARGRQFNVMLVPQFLASPAGTWKGDLKHLRPGVWTDFFDRYDRCVTHFALLAELLDVNVLSIGSEMAPATRRTVPKGEEGGDSEEPTLAESNDAVKRERWTRTIGTARAAFGGALTYSARWPAQAPNIEFWDQLDSVGATLFPALELPDDPSADPSLQRQITTQLWLVRRAANELEKPAIITEIGFRSTKRALLGEVDGGGDLDQARQAELLQQLSQGMAGLAESGRAPHGLFLWNWSSDSSIDGSHARGYSPRGKSAEATLGALFE